MKHAQVDVPELAWKDKAKQSKANYIFFAVFKLKKQATKQCKFTCIGGRGQDKGSMTRPNTSRKFPMNLGGAASFTILFALVQLVCMGFELSMLGRELGAPTQKENAKGFSLGPAAACVSVDIRCLVFAVLSRATRCHGAAASGFPSFC
jgi:hypothetical protein